MGRTLHLTVIAALLFLLVSALFWSATDNEFLRWDDDYLITQNPKVTGLSWETTQWAFVGSAYNARYHPLLWMTWLAAYSVTGLAPFTFHFLGVVLHAANTVLVFLLLRLLLRAAGRTASALPSEVDLCILSVLGALAWGTHPLRVEVVAWVAAFGFAQSFFFLLLTVLFYVQAQAEGLSSSTARSWRLAALGAYVLSLLSYPIGVGLPLVLLALDYYPLKRLPRLRDCLKLPILPVFREKIPFLAAAVAVSAFTLLARFSHHPTRASSGSWEEFGLLARLMQAAYMTAYYLWKAILPEPVVAVNISLVEFDPLSLPFLLSLAAIAALAAFLYHMRNRWPLGVCLGIVHLAIMAPVLGLTEHPHFPSDRYSYAQGVIWSGLLIAGLWLFRDKARWRLSALALAAFMILVQAGWSGSQVMVWQNTGMFFEHNLQYLDSGDPYRGSLLRRLGNYYLSIGQYSAAKTAFEMAAKAHL